MVNGIVCAPKDSYSCVAGGAVTADIQCFVEFRNDLVAGNMRN